MAVTRLRKTALTSSPRFVLSPVPLMMHLIHSMSPMPYVVSSHGLLVRCFSLLLSLLSLLVLLIFSFLFSSFSFFAFLSFLYAFFVSFLLDVFFCPIGLRLLCVCTVSGTMSNIYVVVFLWCQALWSGFQRASSEMYASIWSWHIVG